MEENVNLEEKETVPVTNNEASAVAEEGAKKSCCDTTKRCKCLPIVNCILLVGLILIYIFHFTGIGTKGKSLVNAEAKTPVAVSEGGLKIAYINTDTLMEKYQYAIDLQKQLKDFQTAKQNSYTQQITQYQKDYQAYIGGGAENMTLSQQQAKEKELTERYQRLSALEGELAQQIQERTLNESQKMTNAVYNFIREYNEQNQQFDLILAKSFTSSPILYGNEGMDITDEIVNGLNEEYRKVKENGK